MKSSVQSWFSGSRPYCSRYCAHWVSLRPPRRNEVRVAFGLRDGVAQQQHVAAFLDRHPFAAVVAAGDERIGAQIVRRIRELPVRGGGVAQDGTRDALASVGLSRITSGPSG